MNEHTTEVIERGSTLTPMFQAWCDECGEVGTWQEYEADARTIAQRHQEVGGFDNVRRGSESIR